MRASDAVFTGSAQKGITEKVGVRKPAFYRGIPPRDCVKCLPNSLDVVSSFDEQEGLGCSVILNSR